MNKIKKILFYLFCIVVFASFMLNPAVKAGSDGHVLTEEEFEQWPDLPEYTTFNPFPYKGANCTWYAHGRMMQLGYCTYALDTMRFSAHTWADFANRGAVVSDEPEAGSIAFWDGNAAFGSYLGHVGVVEKLKEDGAILISDSSSSRDPYNTFLIKPDDRRWPTAFIIVPEGPGKSEQFNPGDLVKTTASSLNFRLEGVDQDPVLLSKGTPVKIKEHQSNGLKASRPRSIQDYYHWWYAAVELDGEIEYGWLAEDYLKVKEEVGEEKTEIDPGSDSDSDEETDEATNGNDETDPEDHPDENPDKEEDTKTDPDKEPDPENTGENEEAAFKPGDVNGDGVVDVLDASIVMQKALDLKSFDQDQFKAADVNNDGKVDVLDVVLIMRYSLELVSSF